MSEPCEIVEALVVATSECPVTDVIMVQTVSGACSSTAFPGVTPPTVVSTAAATTYVVDEAYALVLNTAQASTVVSASAVVTDLATSTARGRSRLIAAFNETVVSGASATDLIVALDVPLLAVSVAQAASTATANTTAVLQLTEYVTSTSAVSLGLLESVSATAAATNEIVLLRSIGESATSVALATDMVVLTNMPEAFLLLSSATAVSTLDAQCERNLLIGTSAEAATGVWYKDPARVAWLMNTETTAASWYTNFGFESVAQLPDRVLAVGPDGLYELSGDTDSGELIDAEVISGFTDFGQAQTKRIDAMYFGYTSSDVITVTVEVYESGHPPNTYTLEQRTANSPRNSRVVPGKGLWGRYWRTTIRNVGGAKFEIHDATVDVAVSSRRV